MSVRRRAAWLAALLLSCIVVPVSLASFLGLHELFIGAVIFDFIRWDNWIIWLYALLALGCVGARTVLTACLLRRTARDLAASGP